MERNSTTLSVQVLLFFWGMRPNAKKHAGATAFHAHLSLKSVFVQVSLPTFMELESVHPGRQVTHAANTES